MLYTRNVLFIYNDIDIVYIFVCLSRNDRVELTNALTHIKMLNGNRNIFDFTEVIKNLPSLKKK